MIGNWFFEVKSCFVTFQDLGLKSEIGVKKKMLLGDLLAELLFLYEKLESNNNRAQIMCLFCDFRRLENLLRNFDF